MSLATASPEVNGTGASKTLARLTPRHLAELRASGLSDAQIAACGVYSLRALASIEKALHRKWRGDSPGDCLAFPFFDQAGKSVADYVRLKPDCPRKAKKDGKPIKYESPYGSSNRAYFPPDTLAALLESAAPLVITEGEKKAAKADQEGFPGIGLVGVYGWQKKRVKDKDGKPQGERELIDGLASIPWKSRPVFLCFDSDSATNPSVRAAEWHLAETLVRHGAAVKIVRLPQGEPGPDGRPAKVGLDDFLVAHGPNAFRELMAAATDPEPPPKGLAVIEAADDPHRLAKLYISEHCQHADGSILCFQRERFCKWSGSAYREVPDTELRADLVKTVKGEFDRLNIIAQKLAADEETPPPVRKITKGMVANVEMALVSQTVLSVSVEPPAWWDGKAWQLRNIIALQNGLLDLDALFASQTDILLPHSPRWFSETCLPYPFDADGLCPRWLAFLKRNLEEDRERIALLQEWFGYSLTPDTSRQKFLVLEGEGSNGKSVVCAALEAMLGSDNCSHVSLELFGERFQLTPTIGKLANIVAEVGELDKAAEGFLKSFTSGDAMQFDRKHKPPIQAVPTARLVLATNNRPRFSDRSGGLWRRMILMPFRIAIAENDPGRVFGMDKPTWWQASGELPGILDWALAGLERLRRQDRFASSQICEEALAEYRTENNPARMFLGETCREAPESQVPCAELYLNYRAWCQASGYSPLAVASFGKEVRRVFPKAERREIGGRGSRLHFYCGLETSGLHGLGG